MKKMKKIVNKIIQLTLKVKIIKNSIIILQIHKLSMIKFSNIPLFTKYYKNKNNNKVKKD